MIDEKKLIEEMVEEIENLYGRETELSKKAREYLERHKIGEWIPCSEQLPEVIEQDMQDLYPHVLVYAEEEDKWNIYVGIYGMYKPKEWVDTYDPTKIIVNAIAWQPLPEPYTGHKEGARLQKELTKSSGGIVTMGDSLIRIAKARVVNLDGKAESDAKEISFDFDRAISALEEIRQYRALETARQIEAFIADWRKYKELGNLEKVREAMEKQMAKKPFKNSCEEHTHYKCKCGYVFYIEYSDGLKAGCMYEYCPDCGQHIDWT